MTHKNVIDSIVSFFLQLPRKTAEAIEEYKSASTSANGNKLKMEMASNHLLYFFLQNYVVRIIAPLALITLIILGVTKYFNFIVGIAFFLYILRSHFLDNKNKQELNLQTRREFIYSDVSNFLFAPLSQLGMNCKQPQSHSDIEYHKMYDLRDGYLILYFKLLKKSPELMDEDELNFGKKILTAMINDGLRKKQRVSPHYFYNGVPCLAVDDITDLGDIVLFSIILVNNDNAVKYLQSKQVSTRSSQETFHHEIFDEDM